jgi:hypothetical protein
MMRTLQFTPARPAASAQSAEMPTYEQVLPGVWRWADPAASDRCGTALATVDGVLLVDPPSLPPDARRAIEAAAGPVRHVVLTSARRSGLAAAFREPGVAVWIPQGPAGAPASNTLVGSGTFGEPGGQGADRLFGFDERLPGGLMACQLPAEAAPDGEVALLWPAAGGGLLMVGDVLPVQGQTPVYREGEAPPITAYLDALKALLAAEPSTLAPAHHAPPEAEVILATGWAAHIGSPLHARRAAPIAGPRYLVPQAGRVLEEALIAPVVVRRAGIPDPVGSAGFPDDTRRVALADGGTAGQTASSQTEASGSAESTESAEPRWIADPFACARCGRPNEPMRQTCGGPMIARLCPQCRAERRQALPAARVMVCAGGCCTREGARAVVSAARQAVAAGGLAATVDVVPVSCLGECSLGPFVRLSTAQGEEPAFAADYRARTVARARRYAADEGELIDDESELVLSRFAALIQPSEAEALVDRLSREIEARPGGG